MLRKLKHAVGRTFFDFAYGIAYRKADGSLLTELSVDKNCPENSFRLLKPCFRYWYADPIAVNIRGQELVFMEVFDRCSQKGMIGVSEYDEGGKLKKPEIILEEPFHLSFPIVFEWKEKIYLMPECSESGQLRIYKMCESFRHFELYRSFGTEEELVDTVVLTGDEGLVFLSATPNPVDKKQTALRLFSIDDLEQGELKEHKEAVIEPESGYSYLVRNGGPLVRKGDSIIRVLQESTQNEYGRNVKLALVECADANEWKEHCVKDIRREDIALKMPFWYRGQGTHTYSVTEAHEVMDVSFNRFHIGNCRFSGGR